MEREERFVTLVMFVLIHYMLHGYMVATPEERIVPDLYDLTHCLDDAYFYARNRSDRIMTVNLASEAQMFCSLWMKGNPECKRPT